MRARHLLLLAAGLLLGACQTTYEVERGRSYTDDKRAVWDRLLAFLEDHQIAVTAADFDSGRVSAQRQHYQDQGWADCERRRVYQESGSSRRMSWALRVDRDLVLQAQVAAAAGGTAVTVDARFTEKQDDPNSFNFFTQPCRSKGVLERTLLDALGTPVAASPAQDTREQ